MSNGRPLSNGGIGRLFRAPACTRSAIYRIQLSSVQRVRLGKMFVETGDCSLRVRQVNRGFFFRVEIRERWKFSSDRFFPKICGFKCVSGYVSAFVKQITNFSLRFCLVRGIQVRSVFLKSELQLIQNERTRYLNNKILIPKFNINIYLILFVILFLRVSK